MKKSITCLLLIAIIINISCLTVDSSQTVNVKYYIKDKFPCENIASLNLAGEKKTSVGEELFEQEDKDKKDSDYSEAVNKALYFIDKKEYKKALPYLEIATKTDISSVKARVYFNIGFCYDKLKTYTKAIEAYKQAVRINPDNAIAHFNLGLSYDQLGFHEDAREAYIQAIRIDPDYAEAHYSLGVAYLLIRDRDSALNEYKILKELDIDLANKLFDLIY